MRRPRLLLRENSFSQCRWLSMTEDRLAFDLMVDDPLRCAELLQSGTPGIDLLAKARSREPTRVSLNSPGIRLAVLARRLGADQVLQGGRAVAEASLARWRRGVAGDGLPTEGGSLLLVAFEREQPVGYADLAATFVRLPKQVEVLLHVSYGCVPRDEHGKDYQVDLSVASGVLCSELMLALYSSVPAGTTISPRICQEQDCEECELVATLIDRALSRRAGVLNTEGRRFSISVEEPALVRLQADSVPPDAVLCAMR